MNIRLFFLCLILGSWMATPSEAQIAMNHFFRDYFTEEADHHAVYPLNPFEAQASVDSIRASMTLENNFTQRWLGRKLFNEHLGEVQKEDYRFIFNLLADLRLGRDKARDELLFVNTRGFQATGYLGKNFMFYTDFYENQARVPQYLHNFVRTTKVLPGQGNPKNFGEGGLDYAYANGHISWQANPYINLQFGHGKHFWGDGYRSLLLSDNAFNYPYLRMMTKFWKFKYVNLYAQMLDINNQQVDQTFARKYVTSHYLSFEMTKRLTVSIFESVIYHDTTGTRGYDLNYLNPFIFYRPVEFSLSSRGGNVILGANVRFDVTDNVYLYSQFVLDELKLDEFISGTGWWANKYGMQFGFKAKNAFVENLTLQSEVNFVRPYTYTHSTELQNYGHYNQALAHPLGANFIEWVSHVRYFQNRWFGSLELMYAIQGKDDSVINWGSNIYRNYLTRKRPDFGHRLLQGNETQTLFMDLRLGYLLNPATNLRVEIGYTYRKLSPDIEMPSLQSETTNYFHIGFVTRLGNHYYDF